jgi:hypothetical protein
MLVIYVFAGFSSPADCLFISKRDKIIELIYLQRGWFAIYYRYFIRLASGLFKDCFEILDPNISCDRNSGDLRLLSLLPKLIARDIKIKTICYNTLEILRRLLAMVAILN